MGKHAEDKPSNPTRRVLILGIPVAIGAAIAANSIEDQEQTQVLIRPTADDLRRTAREDLYPVQKPAATHKEPAVTKRDQILHTARGLFGIPYRWGGNTPASGLDCSGYTRLVYARNGLHLPRVADDQYRALNHVRNPRPGDLVFFFDSTGYAHHVGIWVRKGWMYDAPHSGTVVREEAIWTREPIAFGRHPLLEKGT